jgi:hypothetical protein
LQCSGYNGYKFGEFQIKINEADCVCKIRDNSGEFIFKVSEILEIDGTIHFKGQKYENLTAFRTEPFDSGEVLGIFKGSELKSEYEIYSVNKVATNSCLRLCYITYRISKNVLI